ncbi:hypothetical protein AKJ37_02415 [candidate division MSBL1 archaeon SCGC-AAA259I09]|uniref:Uncharacterized protein n=1 Tax=candidate division MSBL1 archaeon SCGC-AAA259I09 TaxID=1698267 RepID=A0A133UU51_9EURY|nr:hypothetical protein AKJ37_02415 [candidate division MSBL1 archaeon SCGC-AAA259I09]
MLSVYSLPFTVNRLALNRSALTSSRSAGPAGRAERVLRSDKGVRAVFLLGPEDAVQAAGPVFFRSISAERVNIDPGRGGEC